MQTKRERDDEDPIISHLRKYQIINKTFYIRSTAAVIARTTSSTNIFVLDQTR